LLLEAFSTSLSLERLHYFRSRLGCGRDEPDVGLPHELLDGCFPFLLDSFPIELAGATTVAEITTPPTSPSWTLKSARSTPSPQSRSQWKIFFDKFHCPCAVHATFVSFFFFFKYRSWLASSSCSSFLTHASSTTIFRATSITSFKPRFTISYE
jgi:hypothetical protein